MFQVKKSSFSRKIHKERKKHKSNEKSRKNSPNDSPTNSNRGSSKDPTSHLTTTAKESNYIKEIQSDDGFSVRLLLFNFITSHIHTKYISSIIEKKKSLKFSILYKLSSEILFLSSTIKNFIGQYPNSHHLIPSDVFSLLFSHRFVLKIQILRI